MATDNEKTPAHQRPSLRLRPSTRAKYMHVKSVKRWTYAEVADAAIDALLRTDPELRRARGQAVPA